MEMNDVGINIINMVSCAIEAFFDLVNVGAPTGIVNRDVVGGDEAGEFEELV